MESIIFNPTQNNTTINVDDIIIVQLQKIGPVKSLFQILITWNPLETVDDSHKAEIRWSIDGQNYAPWLPLPQNGSLEFSALSDLIETKLSEVLFEFRFTRTVSTGLTLTLEEIQIDYEIADIKEEECCYIDARDDCGTFPTGDVGACSRGRNACAGITIKCDTSLFRPEDFAQAMACLYEKQANAAADMFGWTVYYFRVVPDERTRDIILHEYTLYDVVDAKLLKILVPDNEFPSEEIQYNSFDMDFVEDFEVHIMRDHFHRTFGLDSRPQQRDYLYFPLQDRLWEVHSTYPSKADFMQTSVYWKVKLFKWQDKVNVERPTNIDQFVDNLTVNFDEVFKEEEQEEFDKLTKPIQYKPVGINLTDHIRSTILQDLFIEDLELNNYFTRVAKHNYDLTSITDPDIPVLWYREICDYSIEENISFSCWFNSTKKDFTIGTNDSTIIIDSRNGGTDGIQISLNYGIDTGTGPGSGQIDSIELLINNEIYQFSGLPNLEPDKWYGMVVNISNVHGNGDIRIWKIQYNSTLPSTFTTKLAQIYLDQFTWVPQSISSEEMWSLYSGTLKLTNLRLWKEPIPEEDQSFILNQYTVKDAHLLRMADNALKPLITQRFNGR